MTALEIMKNNKIWAVVGASEKEDSYGYKIFMKLKEIGFNVYPVSNKYEEIEGHSVYKTLADLPEKPEVVNFVVNPNIGIKVVDQCQELGIDQIWLQPGTISEELLESAASKNINATEACVLVVANYL